MKSFFILKPKIKKIFGHFISFKIQNVYKIRKYKSSKSLGLLMKDICEICKMIAQVSCSCNNYHRFCLRDYLFTHNRIEGSHIPINLALRKEEISQKFNSTIKNLKLVKSKIISKTNQLIHIIQLIATQQISIIKKK